MIPYLGDFVEDDTVFVMFNTFTSDDPSASSTITDFVNTDVHIHKEDDLTQRNNAAGITVSVNFDGITGSHMIKIDTSDDTVGGFWVAGKDYFVRIEGTTVDGATINAVVAHFSIENRYMRGTDSAALASVCTEARLAELDAANIPADIDAILEDTATTLQGWLITMSAYIDTEVAAIKAKTDNLPADPASETNVDANETKIDTAITDIAAVKADTFSISVSSGLIKAATDNLPEDPASETNVNANETKIDALPTAAEIKTAMEADASKLDHLWEMTEDDSGVRRLTANALEEGPGGGTGLTAQETRDAMKLAPTVGDPAAGSVDEHLDDLPTAAAIKTAIEADGSKLDHLHETTEDDGGVRRFTENALEQAPSGTGGDATAANQATIIGYTALAKKILANKAVQNKLTGVITYYDDDDITPLLTITPMDDGSLITRTPS